MYTFVILYMPISPLHVRTTGYVRIFIHCHRLVEVTNKHDMFLQML